VTTIVPPARPAIIASIAPKKAARAESRSDWKKVVFAIDPFAPRILEMKKLFFIVLLATLALFLSGCVTDYYAYQGGAPMIGQGGASKRVDGIDIWLVGAPPRKFQIIGYIEDSRPGGPIPMARRNAKLAEVAKQQGGDGVLIQSDAAQYMGSVTTGNAYTTMSGNLYGNGFNGSAFTTGTSVSAPRIRREGRFFVIKYL
jgi:hypothetical protein